MDISFFCKCQKTNRIPIWISFQKKKIKPMYVHHATFQNPKKKKNGERLGWLGDGGEIWPYNYNKCSFWKQEKK